MRPRMRWGWHLPAIWAALALVVAAFATGTLTWPDRWNPFAPLWPAEAPNALTPWKLARLDGDAQACAVSLRASTLTFTPVPDRAFVAGCGWRDAVRVAALPARVGGQPLLLTCAAAVSLAMWERHAVQPRARRHLGQSVVGLEHFGSFACRDIAGSGGHADGARGRRSEHASANAVDVAGFVLADGSVVRVARDWRDAGDDPRARFLRDVHDGACAYWRVVLGPRHNAAHRDHFHLDRSSFAACR